MSWAIWNATMVCGLRLQIFLPSELIQYLVWYLISLVNVFWLLVLCFIHSLCLIRLNTCVIHRAWWDDCSEVGRTVISLASSSRANLWSCSSSCSTRPKGIQPLEATCFRINLLFHIGYPDYLISILMCPQEVVVSVLMKLAGGCPSLADQLNVDAFLEQARSYDKASSNPVGWYIR